MALRHFLTLRDLSTLELSRILERASELKKCNKAIRYISLLLVKYWE